MRRNNTLSWRWDYLSTCPAHCPRILFPLLIAHTSHLGQDDPIYQHNHFLSQHHCKMWRACLPKSKDIKIPNRQELKCEKRILVSSAAPRCTWYGDFAHLMSVKPACKWLKQKPQQSRQSERLIHPDVFKPDLVQRFKKWPKLSQYPLPLQMFQLSIPDEEMTDWYWGGGILNQVHAYWIWVCMEMGQYQQYQKGLKHPLFVWKELC